MAMWEWQPLLQSVFVGLLFSFLLAKLISMAVSFSHVKSEPSQTSQIEPESGAVGDSGGFNVAAPRVSEEDLMIAEKGGALSESLLGEDGDEYDDDWEGVESTELDEAFSAASAFVAAAAADRFSQKASNDKQLQLYGLYKIATEGPCSSPQPSALKIAARAKWQAWQKLGAMPPEDAMQKYIDIVTEIHPAWLAGSVKESRPEDIDVSRADTRGPMGPVFSTLVPEDESGNDLKMDDIHAFAREGEADNLLKCIESGVSVNQKDSEGRTPLHWAVDRGHLNITELLFSKNADANAKDKEGQTPLHYAVVCEREAIAELLVKHRADVDLKDHDGESPADICAPKWPWMRRVDTEIEP